MLKIDNITKKFGNITAVDNLNLEIKQGECFGLLGRNGAGKSTTIKMLVGLLKPDAGKIYFDEESIYDKPLLIKKNLAYIPDTPYIYEKLTGIEFLFFVGHMYGLDDKIIKKQAEKSFQIFGFEEMMNKKTEEYSHGMRQKLVFSAALLHNPKFLIVDEPMVGLDPQSAKIVRQIFRQLVEQGVTIVLTTHQLHVAQEVCDRIGIIHGGKMKKLFENRSEFDTNLEEEFLKITGGYDESYKELFQSS